MLLLAAVVSISIVSSAAAQSVVFVVRHAERADAGRAGMMGPDPALSDIGRGRAERLAALLRASGIARIYTTEYRRTRMTAEPLATALHLTITTIPSKDQQALLAALASARSPALVVGHSNTLPAIIKALGVATEVTIDDTQYDDLFIVVRGSDGTATLVRLKY